MAAGILECGLDIRRLVVELTHWCLLFLIGDDFWRSLLWFYGPVILIRRSLNCSCNSSIRLGANLVAGLPQIFRPFKRQPGQCSELGINL